jgi:hypothetical protein
MDEERAEFDSPNSKSYSEGINDEEESKVPSLSIPMMTKTNVKEGRKPLAKPTFNDLMSLEKFKENESFIMG